MAAVTAELGVDQVNVETNADPPQDPQPKRKRRTFTLSDEAYHTLSASSEAQGTNRSRLIEDLILSEHRTVTLSDNAYQLLTNSAEAFATNPEHLVEELVNRCGTVLSWQALEPVKPAPWWQFWRRNGEAPSSQTLSPVLELPISSASIISQE